MVKIDLTHLHLTHWLQKREDLVGYCTTLQQRHTQVSDPAHMVIMLCFPQDWTIHLVTELLEVLPRSRGRRCLQGHGKPQTKLTQIQVAPITRCIAIQIHSPCGEIHSAVGNT